MPKQEEANKPRVYATRALLKEIEPGLFELYRDVMIEEDGIAEKYGKPIHISFLRECAKDEEADLTTSKPDGAVLLLRKLPRGDEIEQ